MEGNQEQSGSNHSVDEHQNDWHKIEEAGLERASTAMTGIKQNTMQWYLLIVAVTRLTRHCQ